MRAKVIDFKEAKKKIDAARSRPVFVITSTSTRAISTSGTSSIVFRARVVEKRDPKDAA